MSSNSHGKMTGRENSEVVFQTKGPSTGLIRLGHRLAVRFTLVSPPPSCPRRSAFRISEDQRVFLPCGHRRQHAVTFGHVQKLPFGVDDLLIPTSQENPLFS